MTPPPTNDLFDIEPQTVRDYLRDIWHAVQEMKTQQSAEIVERKALTQRVEAVERDVRDLRVFTSWVRVTVLTVAPIVAVVLTAYGLLTR